MPHARATGASSLFPSACPLQLGQEMLLRLPFPIMVLMMGGSWERKTFSPFPLYRIPETPERVGEKTSFLFFLKNNDFHKKPMSHRPKKRKLLLPLLITLIQLIKIRLK